MSAWHRVRRALDFAFGFRHAIAAVLIVWLLVRVGLFAWLAPCVVGEPFEPCKAFRTRRQPNKQLRVMIFVVLRSVKLNLCSFESWISHHGRRHKQQDGNETHANHNDLPGFRVNSET